MCMTAPATVRGIPFEHPEYCVRKVSCIARLQITMGLLIYHRAMSCMVTGKFLISPA